VDSGYSIGMDLAGLFPRYINIRRGAYIGLIISTALCPWEILATAATFTSVLNGFTVFITPVCAIQICDYFILRSRRIKLSDLYHLQPLGSFYYIRGINPRTIASWVVGWAPLLPGLINKVAPQIAVPVGVVHLYDLAFIYGFTSAFLTHYAIYKLFPPRGLGEVDSDDIFHTFTPVETRNREDPNTTSSEIQVVEGKA